MSTRLRLIVHAATAATRAARFGLDEELDEGGQADARTAAGALDGRVALSCGHARRCRQTAALLGGGSRLGPAALDAGPDVGLEVGLDSRLEVGLDGRLDDWDLGRWAGRNLAEVGAEDPVGIRAWLVDPDAVPHGGESLTGVLARVGRYLQDVATRPGHYAAVTHPAIVRAAVVHVLGAPPASFWRVDVAPLTQVALSAHRGRWNLRLA